MLARRLTLGRVLTRYDRRAIQLAVRPRSYATTSSNPTTNFYKTFTRPIAKVLLLAVFTYQLAYWSWTKLETDETREKTDATIADLEAKVDEYRKSKMPKGDKSQSSTSKGS